MSDASALVEQILDAWNINNRINLYMLDAIKPEALSGVASSKGRSVGAVFAHMHNNRLEWLKVAAHDLCSGLSKVEKEQFGEKEILVQALSQSGAAITELLQRGLEVGKIKGFKPHPVGFMSYLSAHDAYHRGEIGIILNQSGHPLDKQVSYGIWEWGAR